METNINEYTSEEFYTSYKNVQTKSVSLENRQSEGKDFVKVNYQIKI